MSEAIVANSPVWDFRQKRVLITGGTKGIGNAIASAFAAAGAEVAVTGTRARPEDYDVDLSAFRYLRAELGDRAQREALARSVGELDILVNNAGGSVGNEFELENFVKSIELNLTSAMDLSLRFHESLAARGGSIINIGSLASHLSQKHIPGYTAGKSGMLGMTRALADRWSRDGVRVNMIAPGFIDTGLTGYLRTDTTREARLMAAVPMRRWGRADEISGAVLFLASPAASYITGISLPIDGGVMLR